MGWCEGGSGGSSPGSDPYVDLLGVDAIIYVRDDGSDATGDGSLGAPYATLKYAFGTCPCRFKNGSFTFDITGVNFSMAADPFELGVSMPIFSCPDTSRYTTWQGVTVPLCPINIVATPVDGLAIALPFTVVPDAVTANRYLDKVGAGWSVDQHAGAMMRQNGLVSRVITNTPTTLMVASPLITASPQTFISESAEFITDVSDSVNPALRIVGVGCEVALIGISTDNTGGEGPGVEIAGPFPVYAFGCTLGDLHAHDVDLRLQACWITGSWSAQRATIREYGCVHSAWQELWGGSRACPSVDMVLRGSGTRTTMAPGSGSTLSMQYTNIFKADWVGISVPPNGDLALQNVRIDQCDGDAIIVYGGTVALLYVQGTANVGLGLSVVGPASIGALANSVTLTGSDGDFKNGGNAITTWAAFWLAAPDVDLALLSRVGKI